jgi:hypothetical protein
MDSPYGHYTTGRVRQTQACRVQQRIRLILVTGGALNGPDRACRASRELSTVGAIDATLTAFQRFPWSRRFSIQITASSLLAM